MGKSCKIYKTCCICQRDRHNLEFNSNEKGRVDIKPYCKHCKTIYEGIKQGLVPKEIYIGLDYNTTQLQVDNYGFILFLKEKSFTRVSLDLAERLVQQGAAHVTSPTTIESLLEKFVPKGIDIQDSYQGDLTDALKNLVYTRDSHNCHYCNRKGNTIDHIVPRFNGGLNTPLNLAPSCEECNKLKSNMSKEKFIRHIKNGDYDYFRHAWKSHVRIYTSHKICHTCGEVKEGLDFNKQQINCKKCESFQNSFKLGILKLNELKKIELDFNKVKSNKIKLFDSENEEIGFLSKENAIKIMKMGIVKTKGEDLLQLVFDDKKIKRLYPRFSLDNIKEKAKKQNLQIEKKEKEEEKQIDAEIVDVYTIHNEHVAKIPKTVAKNLCKENIAILHGRNKIKLLRGADETIKQYPKLKEYIFYKINGVMVLSDWMVSVENGEDVSLKEATEILRNKKGKLINLNRIKLIDNEVKQKASS